MTADPDNDLLEFREPRWAGLLGGAPGLLLAWSVLALNPSIRSPWTIGPAAVVTALWLPVLVVAQRRRRGVQVTSSGITIFRMHVLRLPWSEVGEFEVHDSRLRLVTRHGTRITLPLPVRSRLRPGTFEQEADEILRYAAGHLGGRSGAPGSATAGS